MALHHSDGKDEPLARATVTDTPVGG